MRPRMLVALLAAPLLAVGCHDEDPAGPPLMVRPLILSSIAPEPYGLSDHGSFAVFAARIAGLEAALTVASVAEVLADGNRKARKLCHDNPVHGRTGFCWDSSDDDTGDWYPQGLTASWDATADGAYAGKVALLASWYNKTGGKGVRISFVNYGNPDTVTYRHVLLVEPISTVDFRAVSVHAGGVVWYGDYLYVMDTGRGIRVFDLRHIWRMNEDASETHIGRQSDDTYRAFNYRYALPQVGEYVQVSSGVCDPPPGSLDEPLCFSYSGLDRSTTPPSILVGEYYDRHSGARLVRFPLDSVTGLLAADATGAVTAVAAHVAPRPNLQGAVSNGGAYAMSRSQGAGPKPLLYSLPLDQPGDSLELPSGPEDLTYDPRAGTVWTLTEFPKRRMVFSIPLKLP